MRRDVDFAKEATRHNASLSGGKDASSVEATFCEFIVAVYCG
ncbi:MAG: hypothetical protein P8M53_03250 [Pirellulales bacterium]|nr:hypothetical protein [Pirellulales bacterium]